MKNASPETKVVVTSNKQFQCQVSSLKVIKGVGAQNPQPSKKGDGFLSIENETTVVYRTLAGRTLFSGLIVAKSAKVKQCEREEGKPIKYKVKFTCMVTAAQNDDKKSYAIEHL